MNGFRAFLKRKNIEFSAKRYGVDALGAMAQGLFCTLLVGTILNTLGTQFHIGFLSATVVTVGTGETATAYTIGGLASAMVGPAMAVAIGSALQAPPLVLFSLVPVGFATNILGGAGGPLAVLVIAIIAAECGKAVSKETKIDILVTPIVTVLAGIGVAYLVAPPIGKAASWVGNLIMWATELQPFFMGILVSVIVGIALTLPISSAAICAALGLTGLAGGAAVAGCCAQMVGFAVLSFRENKWGGLVSQGLGTSMLQMGNIVRNPKIWIPATLASAITGPIATCIFRLEMNGAAVSSGMGTCGLVGPIGVYTGWVDQIAQGTKAGITGMGGAGFPTHVKISSAVGKADTIIVNGAECEPYITADHRLMLEHGEKIIGGVRFIMKALQLDHAFIGIEDNKMNAVNHLKELVGDAKDITVQALRTRYPQGAEKQLIQAITGREVPPGKLPADVGCCVFNAATTAAIYDAVALGQPVYQRVITITGSAVKNPVNLLAPVGTPFSHLIEEAGGFNGTPARVISGGPMMGFAQYDMSVTMGKASNCVLCLSKEDMPAVSANPTCIRCARCVNVCPMHLTPLFMNMFAKARRWSEVEEYRIMDCMECGSCQYICPARIPLVQQFRTAKFAIRQQAAKK